METINNTPPGSGDTLFNATEKINNNFTELNDAITALQLEVSGYDIPTLSENLNGLFIAVGILQTSLNQSLLSINNSIASQNIAIAELQQIVNNI